MEIIACPECAAPAELTDEGDVMSTHGPVGIVRIVCANRHWFLMTRDRLPRPAAQTRAPRILSRKTDPHRSRKSGLSQHRAAVDSAE